LSEQRLKEIGEKIAILPPEEDAKFHRQVRKIFDQRWKSIETGK
jgi:hypothetical protein